ncbi:MAPEG family protein [Agrobacterium genomosp. 3 str. CIP 111-78]|uniref:MAPEG family protein n=1 Tax=Agrobacterium tumefaciens TaxID=358 RepID=A0AAE6ENE0_AGRTU|nr:MULTISPECIES: MAPEG family protein [Agrobacterium]KNY31078.1 hypothetical protein AKG12_26410 [Agrobacterium sp. SUL3]MCA2372801.1 MAPEG family protein [Agrobacterium tomkonis CIP 111-78]QCM03782.1 MAPEG family protein [Agrobacterium tumefaciens]
MPKRDADVELKQEQRRIYRGSAAAFVTCGVVLGASHVFLPRFIQFPGDDLQSKLTFWASANLFIVIWIMIGIGMVSRGRRHSAQDIRGSAYSTPSPKIAVPVAFLQNTLEQAIVTMFTQLALLLVLGTIAMPLITGSVVLFALGRVTFLAGYPKGAGARSFGMAVTALPSLAAFLSAAGVVIARAF